MKKTFILTTLCLSYIANVDAQVDPYDINDGDNVVKISNSDVIRNIYTIRRSFRTYF